MSGPNANKLAVILLFGLITFDADFAIAGACSEFLPMRQDVVDMAYDGHMAYDDGSRGASVSYTGLDGTLNYDRYDFGLGHISQENLGEAIRQSAFDIQSSIRMLGGEVVSVVEPEKKWVIGDMVLSEFAVIATISNDVVISMVAMATDGRCLHKVHYTPNTKDVDDEGLDSKGLFYIDRFHRALDGLAIYFNE